MTTEIIEINGGDIIVIEDNTVEIIELATQGPVGPPGADGVGVEVDHGGVGASATATIDTVPVSTEKCATWFVCAARSGGGKHTAYHVQAVNDGSGANHVVYGKVREPVAGGPLALTTVVDVVGGQMRLRITNNEAFVVDVSVIRFKVSP